MVSFYKGVRTAVQKRKVITGVDPPLVVRVVVEEEINVIDILKTVTWREVLDMLLGVIMIIIFIFDMVFVFGE